MTQSDEHHLGFGPWAMFWFLGLLLMLFGALLASQSRGWVGACGVGGLIFLSSATVGALLGFIFAVPRVIARGGTELPDAKDEVDPKTKLLSTNTNLERISDWLTTMLVGVGLSQLTNLDALFFQFRTFLEQTATVYEVAGRPSAGILPAIGPFILVFGIASGFLLMYLLTRLVLVGFFRHSEEMLGGVAVAAIQVAVTQARADQGGEILPPQAPPAEGSGGKGEPAEVENTDNREQPSRPLPDTTLLRATQATTLSSDDALEVMFRLLYQAGGYRRVIQMSGELSQSPIAKRADFWFYLAAAFGQQMHHAENDDDRLSARDNALDAARRSVRIDKSFRSRLWQISDPSSSDNDLALLRKDPDFLKIVGRG